jgi:hypothetical protein
MAVPQNIVLFIVTRYNKYMSNNSKKRGRPKKADAKSAAERMRAYRKRKRDAGLTSVRRWEPVAGMSPGRYSDHRILDARSLAMHCKIVQKISRDPRLLEKAKDNLSRWSAKIDGPEPRHLKEWRQILEKPWLTIAEIMTSMSEGATRLRSSSPFAGILNEKEREQIYAAFRA